MRSLRVIIITHTVLRHGAYLISGRGFHAIALGPLDRCGSRGMGAPAQRRPARACSARTFRIAQLRQRRAGAQKPGWHHRYFAALVLAILMMAAALMLGERRRVARAGGPAPAEAVSKSSILAAGCSGVL